VVPLLTLIALLLTAPPGAAPPCRYILGFAALHAAIPAVVGGCADDQASAADGDAIQHTANGLLVWRKASNSAAFTDGARTWALGPDGLEQRPNGQRFGWERPTVTTVRAGGFSPPGPNYTGPCCMGPRTTS